MTLPVDLIIFDCDGVLIDSERVGCVIDARELSAHGHAITPHMIAERFVGIAYADMYRMLEAETGIVLPPGYAERTHEKVLAACAELGLDLTVPGIHAALDALDGRRKCVASSSSPARLYRTLTQVGLWDRFAPHVFSADEVARAKPAPDLFLHAAARMEVEPARCLVIEDSVPGVTGAAAAGMRVIGFTGTAGDPMRQEARLRAAGAGWVLGDMSGVVGMVGVAREL